MKAAVVREHGGPDRLNFEPDFPDPKPGEGDVIVAVRASSLNYHDVFTRRGMPGIKVPMPAIMGLDVAGEIAEVGPGVSGWKKGDRVLVDPINRIEGGLMGETVHGGLAELCKARAHQLIRIPDGVAFADAAALPVAYGTALRMMTTNGHVAAGEKVLILGASGGVGVCCLQLAKLAGAEVIACAGTDAKAKRLAELGADKTINYIEKDFMKEVFALYGKPTRRGSGTDQGVDVVVNYTGGDTWVNSLKCLKVGGRLLTCGATAGFDPKEDIRFIWTFELKVLGSNGWARSDIAKLLQLVQEGKLKVLVDKIFKLDQAREALRVINDKPNDKLGPLTKDELQKMLDHSPFIAFLGLKVSEADPANEKLTMTCTMRPEFERGAGTGQWHGGPLAAIIDTVGDYALIMTLRRGLPTINFRVDYLRPAIKTGLVVTATVRRAGKSVGVVDVDVFNDQKALLAVGRATYSTLTA
jgi:alcohol dehydrogenase